MILGSNRIHVQNCAAHHAAQRLRYYQPRRPVYLRPPQVVRVGPAFAFLVPTMYVVETQAPNAGLHPQAKTADAVGSAMAFVLVLLVVIILTGRIIVRILNEAGEVLAVCGGGTTPG